MSAVALAARVIPTQFAPPDGRRLDRPVARASRVRVSRATVSPRALQRADGDDFELLRELGTVSYAVEQQAGEATLKWRGGDDGTVPDSFSVVGAAPLAGGVAEMKLYAGKVVGWEGPDGGERGPRVPDVLLKEYCNEPAASMADAEVDAYTKLYSNPNDSTIGQTWDGQALDQGVLVFVHLPDFNHEPSADLLFPVISVSLSARQTRQGGWKGILDAQAPD